MSEGVLCPNCGTIYRLESGTRCPTCKLSAVCVECGEVKHRRDFRRLKHIESPKVCEHKSCNACARIDGTLWESKLKYPKSLSKQQLMRAMAAGTLRKSVGELVLQRKRAKPDFNNRGRAVWDHWAKEYAKPWRYAEARLRAEKEIMRSRLKYLTEVTETHKEHTPLEMSFLEAYISVVQRLRAYLRLQSKQQQHRKMANEVTRYEALLKRRAEQAAREEYSFRSKAGRPIKVPLIQRERIMIPSSTWEHYIDREVLQSLRELYAQYRDAVPAERIKTPLLLSIAAEARVCLHGYVHSKRTRDMTDDEARLANIRKLINERKKDD
jgi:hypothetical protein